MFKLVQSAGKPVSGIMTSSMAGQSVKIIKATGQEAAQVRLSLKQNMIHMFWLNMQNGNYYYIV